MVGAVSVLSVTRNLLTICNGVYIILSVRLMVEEAMYRT